MMNSQRVNAKHLYKTSVNVIREVLLQYWDPLNIGDNPNLADEYDALIPQILQSLRAGSTEDALMLVLARSEREN